jgi:hypothetical protein
MTPEQTGGIVADIATKAISLAPFFLGFMLAPSPYCIVFVCMLVIKISIRDPMGYFYDRAYLDYIAKRVSSEVGDELRTIRKHAGEAKLPLKFEHPTHMTAVHFFFVNLEVLLIVIGTAWVALQAYA